MVGHFGKLGGGFGRLGQTSIARHANFIVVQEGDSITAAGGSGYADSWAAITPAYTVHNLAVGGSGIGNLVLRQAAALAYRPDVISVFIGANGLDTTAQAFVDSVYAYTDQFIAIGSKVVICTVIPWGSAVSGYAAFNAMRAQVNAIFKADMGTRFTALADWDATVMGIDATMDNATYSADGVHPTSAGHLAMLPNYTGAMYAALGIAHDVSQFTFTDVNDVALSTVTTSNAIIIGGLNYAETKPVSVSAGGEYQKNGGSWTSVAGTVVNGDSVKVRGTSSASNSTVTNVTLTVGNTSDTFSFETLALADAVWTPNTSPPATYNGDFSVTTHDFTSISFEAGYGVVFVYMQARQCTAVTVNGVACTQIDGGGSAYYIWRTNTALAAGSYTVQVTGSAALADVTILTGTIATSSPTPNSTAYRGSNYTVSPHACTAQLTILSGGIGVCFATRVAAPTWNTGTVDIANSGTGFTSAHFTTSSTPSVSQGDGVVSMAAVAWGP